MNAIIIVAVLLVLLILYVWMSYYMSKYEVYLWNDGQVIGKDELEKKLDDLRRDMTPDIQIATKDELIKAQKEGAQWCTASWVRNGDDYELCYPMQTAQENCGGKAGVIEVTDKTKGGVTLYGKKPREGEFNSVRSWYSAGEKSRWSKYSPTE